MSSKTIASVDSQLIRVGESYDVTDGGLLDSNGKAVAAGTKVKVVKQIKGPRDKDWYMIDMGGGSQIAVDGGSLITAVGIPDKASFDDAADKTKKKPETKPVEEEPPAIVPPHAVPASPPDQTPPAEPPPVEKKPALPPAEDLIRSDAVAEFDFASPAVADNREIIEKDGKKFVRRKIPCLFKPGEYPEKKFSLTKDEAKQAAANFDSANPINFKLAHFKETILDGELGGIDKLAADEEGVLSAEALVPAWFDDMFLQKKGKYDVSAEWNRANKRLTGCILSTGGHIEGAHITAAFDAYRAGREKEVDPNMSTPGAPHVQAGGGVKHGKALWQELCDCASRALADADENTFAAGYIRDLKKICDLAQKNGATYTGKKLDEAGAPRNDGDGIINSAVSTTANYDATVKENEELKKQLAAKTAAFDAERKGRIAAEASVFATEQTTVHHKATPGERTGIEAQYIQAATDDANSTAAFDADHKSRVQVLRDTFAARPVIKILEQAASGNLAIIDGEHPASFDKSGDVSDARVKELLAKSRLGERVLSAPPSKN